MCSSISFLSDFPDKDLLSFYGCIDSNLPDAHCTFLFIQNLGANVSLFLEQIGRIICTMIGMDIEEESLRFNDKAFSEKMSLVAFKVKSVEWLSVFKWKKMKETFMGVQTEPLSFEEPADCSFVSIISVYQTFSVYLK